MNVSSSIHGTRGCPPGPQPERVPAAAEQQVDVARALAPLLRAMGMKSVARGTLLGFALGAALGAAVLFSAHLHPFAGYPLGAVPAALGALVGAVLGAVRRPGVSEAARAADLYFALDDRLTTAWELRFSDSPVAHVQSLDAARHVEGLPLARSSGRWLHRRQAGAVVAAALVLAVALGIGPPSAAHRAVAQRGAKTERGQRVAAAQVRRLSAQLHLGLNAPQRESPAMRQLDLALTRLRNQLLHASTTRAGLRAISATQQQLRQLARSLHPMSAKAAGQLSRSLGPYLGQSHTGGAKGSPTRSMLATAQALNRLAQSLSHLTPAQRAALARALARSANAQSSAVLRSALRQAASSLGYNDPQAARAALQQAAQALARSSGAQNALSQLNAAGAQLEALKSQLSGLTPSGRLTPSGVQAGQLGKTGQSGVPSGSAATGRPAGFKLGSRGQGLGRGLRPGQGRGLGRGRGLQSLTPAGRPGAVRGNSLARGARTGRGGGRGAGYGQPSAARSARGTAGGRGTGGRGRSNLTRRGQSVTVYIPAPQGKGKQIVVSSSNGAPELGNYVPYQEVFGKYTQSAHQALDRAALPPSLQGYVLRYFSSISQ